MTKCSSNGHSVSVLKASLGAAQTSTKFVLPSQGWGDVYYFCGADMRFCTCDFKWNLAGWRKAFILWNFILTTALGLQKLAIKVGLDGLLPGKDFQHHCS